MAPAPACAGDRSRGRGPPRLIAALVGAAAALAATLAAGPTLAATGPDPAWVEVLQRIGVELPAPGRPPAPLCPDPTVRTCRDGRVAQSCPPPPRCQVDERPCYITQTAAGCLTWRCCKR